MKSLHGSKQGWIQGLKEVMLWWYQLSLDQAEPEVQDYRTLQFTQSKFFPHSSPFELNFVCVYDTAPRVPSSLQCCIVSGPTWPTLELGSETPFMEADTASPLCPGLGGGSHSCHSQWPGPASYRPCQVQVRGTAPTSEHCAAQGREHGGGHPWGWHKGPTTLTPPLAPLRAASPVHWKPCLGICF